MNEWGAFIWLRIGSSVGLWVDIYWYAMRNFLNNPIHEDTGRDARRKIRMQWSGINIYRAVAERSPKLETYCIITTSADIREVGDLQLHHVATCNHLLHNLQCVLVQGNSNMTGTDLCVNNIKSVPVTFEPPCIMLYSRERL